MMLCPDPSCQGTIKETEIPKIGECQSCGMISVQCLDFLNMKDKCNHWNFPSAHACRFCGGKKKPGQYEDAIKDFLLTAYIEGETGLKELGIVDIDPGLVKTANFNLYPAGAFFFLLGADGSYAPISIGNTQKPIQLGRIGKGMGWKAYCLDHYAALFCPTQWRIIPHSNFSIQESNLAKACKWQAENGEETIPSQEPIIWDIPGKFTLVSWVTRSSSPRLKIHWRTILDQGNQFHDYFMEVDDFTGDKFFCWEKLSLLPINPDNSPDFKANPLELQVIIGCANGFYTLDFSNIAGENFQPTLKPLTSKEDTPFYFDPKFKELDRDLFVEPFLPFHFSPTHDHHEIKEIHEILACKKENSREFVVGIPFPPNGNMNRYAHSSPGSPLCLGDMQDYFTLGKNAANLGVIRKCSFSGQCQEIEETTAGATCKGAKYLRSYFLSWFNFNDGKLDRMNLNINDLRRKGEQNHQTNPNSKGRICLESSFLSNPVATHRGILFVIEKDNKLVLSLLPFKTL